MLIASDVGTTFALGAYMVRISLRTDNPAFATYSVFRKGRFIGKQFSRPSVEDCAHLERWGNVYATESHWPERSTYDRRSKGAQATTRARQRRRELAPAS